MIRWQILVQDKTDAYTRSMLEEGRSQIDKELDELSGQALNAGIRAHYDSTYTGHKELNEKIEQLSVLRRELNLGSVVTGLLDYAYMNYDEAIRSRVRALAVTDGRLGVAKVVDAAIGFLIENPAPIAEILELIKKHTEKPR